MIAGIDVGLKGGIGPPIRKLRGLRLRYANIRKRGKSWGTGSNLQKPPVTLRKTKTQSKPQPQEPCPLIRGCWSGG